MIFLICNISRNIVENRFISTSCMGEVITVPAEGRTMSGIHNHLCDVPFIIVQNNIIYEEDMKDNFLSMDCSGIKKKKFSQSYIEHFK